MRGGIHLHRGSARSARAYVECGLAASDDYYLREAGGVARRFGVDADGRVVELAPLTGPAYEAWVLGADPVTGEPRGRVRSDEHAVRFGDFTVNGPKSWSLAAALHPEISAALDAAQLAAASQVLGWLGEHMTVRVGPRGAQVPVGVERLEAAVVEHHTSRAGDPHRHLHVQVNVRVHAAGAWRGLDTVALLASVAALNGIGHAAVMCDPHFRNVLAAHGYTLNAEGEIEQLEEFVGPFSKRAAQITANIERYEDEWRRENPGREPEAALRRGWDRRAWAEQRPDKNPLETADTAQSRWLDELADLGHRPPNVSVQLAIPLPAAVDRAAAAREVVARLGAARSAWNAADLRGETELLLARHGVITSGAVRVELAEDITTRAVDQCVWLRDDRGAAHVRALTSEHVLAVEADLAGRFALRAALPVGSSEVAPLVAETVGDGLDVEQRAAVAAITGPARLVVIEGAAGAGKTTLLRAARQQVQQQARRLVVVTPTLRAAQVAAGELRARTGSIASLLHRHGWRWDDTGTWTRLAPGATDPVTGQPFLGPDDRAAISRGDVVLVDEAGMVDQDTALALLTVADEHAAAVVLVGDRAQLPAIGRGGVLDLAHRWADPAAVITLDTVHRFTDPGYAALTLALRAGDDPGAVFDELTSRGLVAVHPDHASCADAVATAAAADGRAVITASTGEQVAALNAAVRARRVATGDVDDTVVVVTGAGERIGRGDVVATRRNDAGLGVANRDTWTVTAVGPGGGLTLTPTEATDRREPVTVPAGYVTRHVELAYVTTVHGAQGATTDHAHAVLDEQHSTGASIYVGMTRGRRSNTIHLVADHLDAARDQWIVACGRDRADLGPAHAGEVADTALAGYAPPPPPPNSELEVDPREVLEAAGLLEPEPEPRAAEVIGAEYRAAAHRRDDTERALGAAVRRRDKLLRFGELRMAAGPALRPERTAAETATAAAQRARADADRLVAARQAAVDALEQRLTSRWDAELPVVQAVARTVRAGPGRIGRPRWDYHRACEQLTTWSLHWVAELPGLTTRPQQIAAYLLLTPTADVHLELAAQARRIIEPLHPDAAVAAACEAADQAEHGAAVAEAAYRRRSDALTAAWVREVGADIVATSHPNFEIRDLDRRITVLEDTLAAARDDIDRLVAEDRAARAYHAARTPVPDRAAAPGPRDDDRRPPPRFQQAPRRRTTPPPAAGDRRPDHQARRRLEEERRRALERQPWPSRWEPPRPGGHGIGR